MARLLTVVVALAVLVGVAAIAADGEPGSAASGPRATSTSTTSTTTAVEHEEPFDVPFVPRPWLADVFDHGGLLSVSTINDESSVPIDAAGFAALYEYLGQDGPVFVEHQPTTTDEVLVRTAADASTMLLVARHDDGGFECATSREWAPVLLARAATFAEVDTHEECAALAPIDAIGHPSSSDACYVWISSSSDGETTYGMSCDVPEEPPRRFVMPAGLPDA